MLFCSPRFLQKSVTKFGGMRVGRMWCSMNCHVDVLTLPCFGGNARMIRGGHRFSMEIGHWATTLVKKQLTCHSRNQISMFLFDWLFSWL